ncbi:tRNA preQ1(34) S-adenosylmethionine ribosyltransferase-isomerase QueA [Gallionella capsiferriformans]|jgi:S-adenosylmethionine:tRNA ribosyltransferase-isomerase|uniref:S-adenosylmethionine:tRNA ribosyltransferase-isomerase n=1 Tax=Gallionella capsiferriformans (strain ES-2) TaxID=395494 RepID=D9SJB0_GALCS|nr:tRNA preQ1(34) S-adenosylmethionine ribosyltransferase-isomerase QueA [Gallionella capsiferriformans]ADL56298.1 S-adenosylmethionine/tRNA-ribosyltransferase-isomerase [Gallionella capsiferriformans ES-2]
MRTDEFDFALPDGLIAQHPPEKRGASRLLCVHDGILEDSQFVDLLQKVAPGDLLVLNDTRVIRARLFGIKRSGGKIEVMVERVLNNHEVLAQVRASKSPPTGSYVLLAGELSVEVMGRAGEFYHLRFCAEEPVLELLERYGRLPLPPYITHAAEAEDETRYQTVFARQSGAVAAPTAGLHFDDAMLEALQDKGVKIAYVTLHVGAGTFQPVRAEWLSEHIMHSECYQISQATVDAIEQTHAAGGRVVAVGTTSLRALESAAASGELQSGAGETRIFITPGYRFRVVDVLLTNFHLPKSTLLMLVSAFGGMSEMRAAYLHAVAQQYRFFSYGDAMLIEKSVSGES